MLQYLDLWNGFYTAQTFPEMLRILPPRYVSENLDFTYETSTEWMENGVRNTLFRLATLLQMPKGVLPNHKDQRLRSLAMRELELRYDDMREIDYLCVEQQVDGYHSEIFRINDSNIEIFKLLRRMSWTPEERERLLTLNGRKQFTKDELSNICDWCGIRVLAKWRKPDYVKALIDYIEGVAD